MVQLQNKSRKLIQHLYFINFLQMNKINAQDMVGMEVRSGFCLKKYVITTNVCLYS